MDEYQRIMAALRNAHAAGDRASAQRLAAMAQAARSRALGAIPTAQGAAGGPAPLTASPPAARAGTSASPLAEPALPAHVLGRTGGTGAFPVPSAPPALGYAELMGGRITQENTPPAPYTAPSRNPMGNPLGVVPVPHFDGRDNLWGSDDGQLSAGETMAAALNMGGEVMTAGLVGDETGGRLDEWMGRGSYEDRRDLYREQGAQLWSEHPAIATAATVGGALLGPGKGAGAFINAGRGLLARVGRGAVAAAVPGAIYGATEAEDDLLRPGGYLEGSAQPGGAVDRTAGALLGAATGGVLGGALTAVGQGFTRAAQAFSRNPALREATPTMEGLTAASQALYRAADASGDTLDASALSGVASSARTALQGEGYHPRLHPRVGVVLDELEDLARAGSVTLSRLDQARRVAMAAGNSVDPDERRLAGVVIDRLDDALDGMMGGDSLRSARELWARMRRMGRVEDILGRAENAGPTSNPADVIASGFRSLLNNPRARRGFTEAELRVMRQVARGGSGIARALGGLGRLLSPLGVPSLAGTAYAYGAAGAAGLAVPAIAGAASGAARMGATALRTAQAQGLPAFVGHSNAYRSALEDLATRPNALAGLVPAAPMVGQNALAGWGLQ